MRMFEFLQEDISQDMKNIKDIRMLNKVLDADAKALLTQVWNSNSVPIEKKEAYIEMLMDKVNTPAPSGDPVEEPVKTTTNYTPTSNNKFKTAKLKGHGKGRPGGLPKWWERAVQLKRQNPNMGAWELIANIDDTVEVESFREPGDVKKGVNKRIDINIDNDLLRRKWVGYTLDDNEMKRWLTQPIPSSENWAWAKNNTYPPFKVKDFPKDSPRLPKSFRRGTNIDDELINHPSLAHLKTYLPYNYERLGHAQRQQASQSITKAKEKVASIGHNQPPQQPKSDPDIGPIVRPERTGWEQSKDSSGRSNKGQGPATIGTYDAPGVDLDAFPDGQDDYGVNTYSDYSSDGGGKIAHLQRRSEPLSNFDGPLVGGVDGQDDEQTKDTVHRDLDAFSDLTPDYIEDIETEYQNGANPNEIARTLSQTYGLPIASALKIVDNWVNFSTRRGAKSNANAKSIRQMTRIERNKKTGGRRFFQPKEKEEEDSENLNEFHKEYQMAVKKLSETSNSN